MNKNLQSSGGVLNGNLPDLVVMMVPSMSNAAILEGDSGKEEEEEVVVVVVVVEEEEEEEEAADGTDEEGFGSTCR